MSRIASIAVAFRHGLVHRHRVARKIFQPSTRPLAQMPEQMSRPSRPALKNYLLFVLSSSHLSFTCLTTLLTKSLVNTSYFFVVKDAALPPIPSTKRCHRSHRLHVFPFEHVPVVNSISHFLFSSSSSSSESFDLRGVPNKPNLSIILSRFGKADDVFVSSSSSSSSSYHLRRTRVMHPPARRSIEETFPRVPSTRGRVFETSSTAKRVSFRAAFIKKCVRREERN